ncbi:ankyrin repeat-containing domain protein [Pyronema domesticum]|nr:ankyrin repeat-containing domain protein [Pyronema domesticum]
MEQGSSVYTNRFLQKLQERLQIHADLPTVQAVNQTKNVGYALQIAAFQGHVTTTHYLVEQGANVNTEGGKYATALLAAANRGNETVVRILIEKGANVNTQGGFYPTALQVAERNGNEAMARLLIENGAIDNRLV